MSKAVTKILCYNKYQSLLQFFEYGLNLAEYSYISAVDNCHNILNGLNIHKVLHLSIDPLLDQVNNKYITIILELIDDFKASMSYQRRNNAHEEDYIVKFPKICGESKIDYAEFKLQAEQSVSHPLIDSFEHVQDNQYYVNVGAEEFLPKAEMENLKRLIAMEKFINEKTSHIEQCSSAICESLEYYNQLHNPNYNVKKSDVQLAAELEDAMNMNDYNQ